MPLTTLTAIHTETNQDVRISVEMTMVDRIEEYKGSEFEGDLCYVSSSEGGWSYLVRENFNRLNYMANGFAVELIQSN